MPSISKRPRYSRKLKIGDDDDDNKDRISALPVKILVHILSFLPTKHAVATSIISARWRNLWTSVPVLDIDDIRYGLPGYVVMNFVDKVLLRHDFSDFSKFRLQCIRDIDRDRLNVWMMNAVKHRVQEIDVSIRRNSCVYYLPLSLCTSETLVVLRLGSNLAMHLPTSVWFPKLKILEISVFHPDHNLTQKLFCSCPVLENLIIEAELEEGEERIFNVVISSLKRLTINLTAANEHDQYHDHKILIDTPCLENLSLRDDYLACYSVESLSSLVRANVDIGQCWMQKNEYKGINLSNRLYDLFKGLSTVKSLLLSLEVLDIADDYSLPVFYELIHVDMRIHSCISWCRLLKLLKSMPNLEILQLSVFFLEGVKGALQSQEIPSCLLSHLKELKVKNFDGSKDKMNLVKYLLKNSEVLQKATIGFDQCVTVDVKKKKKIGEELLSCTKCSKSCQINCF